MFYLVLSKNLENYDWKSFRFLEVIRVNNVSLAKENVRKHLRERGIMMIDSLEEQTVNENVLNANMQ